MRHDNEDRPDGGADEEEGRSEDGRSKGRRGKDAAFGRSRKGSVLAYVSLVFGIIGIALAGGALLAARSGQEKLAEASVRITDLTQRLAAVNESFAKSQAILKQQKAVEDETNRRLDDRDALIVHALSQVQVRLKVTPTLEKMLEPVGSPMPAQPQAAVAPAAALTPMATPVSAVASVLGGSPKTPSPDEKAKIHSQVQGIRDAIRKFNEN